MLKVQVYRYNPDVDNAPYMKSYEIDTQGKDLMVLDVLELLQLYLVWMELLYFDLLSTNHF